MCGQVLKLPPLRRPWFFEHNLHTGSKHLVSRQFGKNKESTGNIQRFVLLKTLTSYEDTIILHRLVQYNIIYLTYIIYE